MIGEGIIDCVEYPIFGNIPSPRCGAGYISIGKKLYIFGGYTHIPDNVYFDDHFVFDLETMNVSKLEIRGVQCGSTCGSCLFVLGKCIYLVNGYSQSGYRSDIFCLDTETMEGSTIDQKGEIPPSSISSSSVFLNGFLLIFGGEYEEGDPSNELYVLDTNTWTWSKPKVSGEIPEPRFSSSMILVNDLIYIINGKSSLACFSDVYTLNYRTFEFKKLNVNGDIPDRSYGQTLARVDDKILLFGGSQGTFGPYFSGAFLFNTDTYTWKKLQFTKPPPNIYYTASLYIDNQFAFYTGAGDIFQTDSAFIFYLGDEMSNIQARAQKMKQF